MTGLVLMTAALVGVAILQVGGGGGGNVAAPPSPSRPAAGPDLAPDDDPGAPSADDTTPEKPAAPEPRKPEREPVPEDRSGADVPAEVPVERPAELPAADPVWEDPSGADWYGTYPQAPSEEATSETEPVSEYPLEDSTTDAVPLASDEPAAGDAWSSGRDRYTGADRVEPYRGEAIQTDDAYEPGTREIGGHAAEPGDSVTLRSSGREVRGDPYATPDSVGDPSYASPESPSRSGEVTVGQNVTSPDTTELVTVPADGADHDGYYAGSSPAWGGE